MENSIKRIPEKPVYMADDILRLSQGISLPALTSMSPTMVYVELCNEALKGLPQNATYGDLGESDELDFAFACCRLVAAYNQDIRDELLIRSISPKLVSLGCLLMFMAPMSTDQICVEKAIQIQPQRPWLLELIHAHLSGAVLPDQKIHITALRRLSDRLKLFQHPAIKLWRIEDIPAVEFAAFQAEMKVIYKEKGQAAATRYLQCAKDSEDESILRDYLRYRFVD